MSQAFGALFFVLGVLLLFALGFGFFLILPFFVFLFGIVAMIISDRKRSPERAAESKEAHDEAKQGQAA